MAGRLELRSPAAPSPHSGPASSAGTGPHESVHRAAEACPEIAAAYGAKELALGRHGQRHGALALKVVLEA